MRLRHATIAMTALQVVASLTMGRAEPAQPIINFKMPSQDGEAAPSAPSSPTGTGLLFVGGYTRDEGWVKGKAKGVQAFSIDPKDGKLTALQATPVGNNPTYIAGKTSGNGTVLYVSTESNDPSTDQPGKKTGFVYAMAVNPTDGSLKELNKMESGGGGTCHVSVSPDGNFVAAANYAGGSVSVFPVNPDGSLQKASDIRQFEGSSKVVPDRQEAPHMHSMTWLRAGGVVLGADLGNDRIAQFQVDPTSKKLVPNTASPFITRPGGSGPRHIAIHPTKAFAYVLDEIKNTIGVYLIDASKGSLGAKPTQDITTLPDGFSGKSTASELAISANGKFLYSTNRGHDSIAGFSIGEDGNLKAIGHTPSEGKTPRSLTLFGDFLIVGNQDSDNLAVFKMDPATGALTFTKQVGSAGTPSGLYAVGTSSSASKR